MNQFPDFANLEASEILLLPGEVVYVPSWWIHSIVNLGMNIQCNTRSGVSQRGTDEVYNCGFQSAKRSGRPRRL